MSTLEKLAVIAIIGLLAKLAHGHSAYEVLLEWSELDYDFPEGWRGNFIRENNALAGIKILGDKVYLTVPRWRSGIPATLVQVDLPEDGGGKSPKLKAYPSWPMQEIGDCKAFQYVQSMEIDQYNRMWIIDVGRTEIFGANRPLCPPKLVLLDMNTGNVIHSHEFPPDVVSSTSNFMNDIVVACDSPTDCFAYITDAIDSKIIMYNLAQDKSFYVYHKTMDLDPDAKNISINGKMYSFKTNVDGIAMSPRDTGFSTLYYAPLSSRELFSVKTEDLRSANNGETLDDFSIERVGSKTSQSDGLAMDNERILYYGMLSNNSINYFNTSNQEFIDTTMVQNDNELQWPDTFAFDTAGYLYSVSNRLHLLDSYKKDEINFRVIRVYIGSKSYMYPQSDKPAPRNLGSLTKLNANEDSRNGRNVEDNPTNGSPTYTLDFKIFTFLLLLKLPNVL